MNFIDKTTVEVIAGSGGNGKMSFRQEKFIDKGGPDGGDGGNGGNVVFVASRNQNTLAAFRYQREVKAESGQGGGTNKKHGRSAPHFLVPVPVGTTAVNEEGEIVADLTEDGQQVIVAKAGRGGFGNAHFLSSTRQTPKFAEKGEPGDAFKLTLELKMIADVGLVGLPNAGKSTLLSRISNARPEIADYPFTTLRPNLGVVDIDKESSVLFADIPGLIEGASEGKGLGHEFLRHIERTAVIVHLIDAYQSDVAATYTTVKAELAAYQKDLAKRPEIIALNKIDGLDDDIVADQLDQIRKVAPKSAQLFAISAQAGMGLQPMLFAVKAAVAKARAKQLKKIEDEGVPVLKMTDTSQQWTVTKRETGEFYIAGHRIEKFAARTEFENEEGLRRLRDIMRKMGIMHELNRKGLKAGNTIIIGRGTGNKFEY